MVYVVAAYSITFGALAIYGVWLQSRAQLARVLAAGSGRDPAALGRGFNLGALLLAPFWAWFHGLRAFGFALLATSLVSIFAAASGLRVAAIALVAIFALASIGLGFVGNRLAADRHARTGGGLDAAAFVAGERSWALAGAVIHTVLAPWAGYFWLSGG
ncbi:MAG: hypothetical protein R3F21_10105 [Myxococcota bacterium]